MDKVKESNIVGQFRGWKKGRGYKLANGDIWKQLDYVNKYNLDIVSRPKAIIWKDGGKFYLEVEGMADKVEVKKGSTFDLDDDY